MRGAIAGEALLPIWAVIGSSGSIFSPESPNAGAITSLFITTLWICAVIFAVVAGLVGYSLVKYRWHEGEAEPAQLAGSKAVEVTWTVIPFLIVLLLFGLTVHAMNRSDPPSTGRPDLVVIGHQWWWEVRDRVNGFVTANEIHIPVGRPISIELDATDVLHEFWVPQLTRKMTTVPGARNHIWIEADKPGTYEGVCSEFCGTQHAWMRFEVMADPPATYAAWVRHQQQPAAPVSSLAARGRQIFREMTCVNCHAIRETRAAPVVTRLAALNPADGNEGLFVLPNSGPDLTHLESRRQIGSGIVLNTRRNLRRWLADPQQVKPGVKMPNFKLSKDQIDALLAYLETLR